MGEKVKITFLPSRAEGYVEKGTTVLEAAGSLGVVLEGPCGGTGSCGRDIVQVRLDGKLSNQLACRTLVTEEMEVTLPHRESGRVKAVEGFFNSARKEAPRYGLKEPLFRKEINHNNASSSTKLLADGRLVATEQNDTTAVLLGVALDIGTTTLVGLLVDIKTGKTIASASMLNPLVHYGHDVMSRIRYSTSKAGGLDAMHRELISAVNLLIGVLAGDGEFDRDDIYHLTAAGNTTMQHIFLNRDIKSIGEYPYTAELLDAYEAASIDLAIEINEAALVETFPCISAFLGGDIASGLAALDFGRGVKRPALLIDIGTNGEIVLLTDKMVSATSCAAGPCFEGMSISSGMRAAEGAVEGVSLDGVVKLKVIGETSPRGICGSGLLELTSELIRSGLIDKRGRLATPCDNDSSPQPRKNAGAYLIESKGKRQFRLADGVTISQQDIRQIQLARAAINSGVEFLLKDAGVKSDDINEVLIAGGFGYHLSEESIYTVGLIPKMPNSKFSFLGNSSLEGARRALLDKNLIKSAKGSLYEAKVLELSCVEGFEDAFIKAMHFG